MENLDFLVQPSDERLRYEAVNILDSYANPWDILAEALQNAVDAVEARAETAPESPNKIRIDVDVARRAIEITDTGIGMSREELTLVLTPHIPLKRGDASTRGEKGIGLSFLVFSCNDFEIRTSNGEEHTRACVRNASDWAAEMTEERPQMALESTGAGDEQESPTYTIVRLGSVPRRTDTDVDVFDYTLSRLVHVLRTRTAVGNTRHLFARDARPEVDIDVELQFTRSDGDTEGPIHVAFAYADPASYLDPADLLEFEDYQELLKDRKERAARGKSLIYRSEQVSESGRPLACYAFASSRRTYAAICETEGLVAGEEEDVQPGIFVSTRSMPTGIPVPVPRTTAAGYWQNLYVVIEDDELRFDLGRKSLRGRAVSMFKDAAEKIFRELVNHIADVIPETVAARMKRESELSDAWDEARQLPALNVEGIPYLKEPRHEQGVVALFHEMLGHGLIKGYRTCRNSSRDQYDALVRYSISKSEIGRNEAQSIKTANITNDIVIEFKYDGADLLDDLRRERKKYEDIRLLVCWELDEGKLTAEGIRVERVSPGNVYFYATTHRLLFPPYFALGQSSLLPVIVLRSIVEKARS